MSEQPNTVCPSCGKDAYEREGNVVWVKDASRFAPAPGGGTALARCGHCGWERPGIRPETVPMPSVKAPAPR